MKVLAAFFRHDYGEVGRGLSNEHLVWVDQLRKTGVDLDVFYLEEHGYPADLPGLQEALVLHVTQTRPDVVFFMFMRDEISLETLDRLNSLTKTVNWFCDDQWRFDSYSIHRAPHLTLCLTVDKYCVEKYRKAGFNHVRQVSWGPSHIMAHSLQPPTGYEFDVSFVGQINPTRAWLVEELRVRGIEVACFGPGWPNGKITFDRMREIFHRSKVNLNLSNSVPSDRSFQNFARRYNLREAIQALGNTSLRRFPKDVLRLGRAVLAREISGAKNREQMKARYFEIPACGGFQVGRMVLGLDEYFLIGREIAVYTDVNEIVEQVNYYLGHEDERQSVVEASFVRVKQYEYHRQLAKVFQELP